MNKIIFSLSVLISASFPPSKIYPHQYISGYTRVSSVLPSLPSNECWSIKATRSTISQHLKEISAKGSPELLDFAERDFDGVKGVLSRRVSWLAPKISFEKIPASKQGDIFRLSTSGNKLHIEASSQPAAAMAVTHYLRYYCKQSFSLMNENIYPLKSLPRVKGKIEKKTPFDYRHANYHCTHNYTQSFWTWKDWERCIDWYALQGVNMMLTLVGTEALEQQTLQQMGYNQSDILKCIPGPAYTNWHLLGNLEGTGGPVTQNLIDKQMDLQQKILKRLDELAIEPIMQGFCGLVPSTFKKNHPQAKIVDQGAWANFTRPAFLATGDPLFNEYADAYYGVMEKLYGKRKFFSADLFHEGGVWDGIDIPKTTVDIQKAMIRHHPEAVWIVQAWDTFVERPKELDNLNPPTPMLKAALKDHMLVWEIFGESYAEWERRDGFYNTPFIWGTLTYFGGRSGLNSKLDRFTSEILRMRKAYPELLKGVGTNPEAIENNPVWYDLVYTLAWNQDETFRLDVWLKDFTFYRYGKKNSNVEKAWAIMHKTVFNSNVDRREGAPEAIFCAKPDTGLTKGWVSGNAKIAYDPLVFEEVGDLMLAEAGNFQDNEAFKYDLLEVMRQILANRGNSAYYAFDKAIKDKDLKAFNKHSKNFLSYLTQMDELCNTHSQFRINRWLKAARDMGDTPQEKELCEANARALLTSWGSSPSTSIIDYAQRQWAGLLKDYYYPRWKAYISYQQKQLMGQSAEKPTFDKIVSSWNKRRNDYKNPISGNLLLVGASIIKKLNDTEK